ncbi:hypothetical protein, partial [Streptomyces abikoensis]|uniref:hypothetical protein n=1 Tax=Streptomyces abikoensis TaxID=97398 RepID=UPI0036B4B6F4
MSAPDPSGAQLLVVIDPVARRVDGESTRIARDVLCAGAVAKICLPGGPEEVARAVARRGRRRVVVIGDDRALLRVVGLLHRRRELADAPLAWVPVGALPAVSVARVLGVPLGTVAASRAVLDGAERRLGLLADESDGVVLGGLWAPAGAVRRAPGPPRGAGSPAQAAAAVPAPGGGPEGGPGGPGGSGGHGGPSGPGGHHAWWTPAARTAPAPPTHTTPPAPRPPPPGCAPSPACPPWLTTPPPTSSGRRPGRTAVSWSGRADNSPPSPQTRQSTALSCCSRCASKAARSA